MEDESPDVSEMYAEIPLNFKDLRCCLRCALLKTVDQFYESGCENCEFLHLAGDQNRINKCTSAYFAGMIALLQPRSSWVARYQNFENAMPGLYAIDVVGDLPQDVIEYCDDHHYSVRSQKKK